MSPESLRFPEGFVWGSGISAHQTEGDNRHNDWWAFEQRGHVAQGQSSGRAADHYHRYAQDFALAASLGQTAIKISVEWSRIEKERGVYDEAELAHYADVVKAARDAGLAPWVVLHHFTNPAWLGTYRWWESPETPRLFEAFVRAVVPRLSPWVDTWITVNEPMLVASAGYFFGLWPPERKSPLASWRVAKNLVAAHRLAYAAIRELDPDSRIGPAVNVTALKYPGRPAPLDRLIGGWLDWVSNYYFVDRTKATSDFVGVQYYTRATVQQLLSGNPLAFPRWVRRLPTTDLGWEIYPKGLYYMVRNMARRTGLPIYVTENGIADATDSQRTEFIRQHLVWLHRAIQEGVDVRGYLHWALIDNFEWRDGFDPRFGLIKVDYDTMDRIPRESARFYERVCRDNTVPL